MVYLIHFDRRISDRHTTQHYTGYCADGRLSERLAEHRAGTGARLTQVANERGIGFEVVRVWDGGRDTERQIKRRHEGPRLCPLCNGESTRAAGIEWQSVPEISY